MTCPLNNEETDPHRQATATFSFPEVGNAVRRIRDQLHSRNGYRLLRDLPDDLLDDVGLTPGRIEARFRNPMRDWA